MTEQIPQRGDIMQLGENKVLITETRDGKVLSFKRLQTTFIQFKPDDTVIERQQLIRDTMKDRLPIELINVSLKVDGLNVCYGYDQDLRHADSITLIYTK